MTEFKATDAEREYMQRPLTDAERSATKNMPPSVARGFVIQQRAQYLTGQRQDQRREKITRALMDLAEAMQE